DARAGERLTGDADGGGVARAEVLDGADDRDGVALIGGGRRGGGHVDVGVRLHAEGDGRGSGDVVADVGGGPDGHVTEAGGGAGGRDRGAGVEVARDGDGGCHLSAERVLGGGEGERIRDGAGRRARAWVELVGQGAAGDRGEVNAAGQRE